MSAMQTFEAMLAALGGALLVYHFSRPSSGARAVLITLFLGASALAAMVLSLHAILTGVAGGY